MLEALAFLVFVGSADCAGKENACAFAEVLVEMLAPGLPRVGDDGSVLVAVEADGPRFRNVLRLTFTADDITRGLAKTGRTPELLAEVLQTNYRYEICNAETMGTFVNLGGIVEQIVQTSDGLPFARSVVDDCS